MGRREMGAKTQGMGACGSLILLIPFLLSLFFSSFLCSQPFELERELDLNEEQKEKIARLREDYLKRWHYLQKEAIKRKIEIRRILNGQDHEKEKIERLEEELDRIEQERDELLRDYRKNLRRILNEKQYRTYEDFCKERKRGRWR